MSWYILSMLLFKFFILNFKFFHNASSFFLLLLISCLMLIISSIIFLKFSMPHLFRTFILKLLILTIQLSQKLYEILWPAEKLRTTQFLRVSLWFMFFHAVDSSVRASCCSGGNAGEQGCSATFIPQSRPAPRPDTGTIPSTGIRCEICHEKNRSNRSVMPSQTQSEQDPETSDRPFEQRLRHEFRAGVRTLV